MTIIDKLKSRAMKLTGDQLLLLSYAFQALVFIGVQIIKINPVAGYSLVVIGVLGVIYFFGKLVYMIIKYCLK